MRHHWTQLVNFCIKITDDALAAILPNEDPKSFSSCRRLGGDFSVGYALHYPNEEGGAPTVDVEVAGQAGINVKASVSKCLKLCFFLLFFA